MLNEKHELLLAIISEMKSVVVAFSGGVDSTFLLYAAIQALGQEHVLAVTADSESYPPEEMEEARQLARRLNVRQEIINISELEIAGYRENDRSRCYFCKHNLFSHLQPFTRSGEYKAIAYGLIADDVHDYRPGILAAKELGIRSPLQEAGFTKQEIRELSRRNGLPTWDKPSFACLSSRIAYGEVITAEKLTRIWKAERYIKSLGIRQVRVRNHGNTARIEVEPEDVPVLAGKAKEVFAELSSLGYIYVTLDLRGYQSGSMNQELEPGMDWEYDAV